MKSLTAYILPLCVAAQLLGMAASAQSLSGRVTDELSGKPVEGAAVVVAGSTKGTSTNAEGYFRLTVTGPAVEVEFSHLSYFTRKQSFNMPCGEVGIALNPKSHPLKGFEVKPYPVTEVLKGHSFDMLDYEFLDEHILLLANRRGSIFRPCLLLISREGDTLATLDVSRPSCLYRDFEGSVYFLSKAEAFGISVHDGKPVLEHVMGSREFLETYPAVVDKKAPLWVLRRYQRNQQALDYFMYAETDREYALFCSVTNEPAIARARWGPYFDGTAADEHFARIIINRPVYAPMFRKGDSLVLFNFLDQKICFFDDSGMQIAGIPGGFMRDKSCRETLIKDEITGNFYVLYMRNGISSLHRINLKTGAALACATIPGFVYAEKIRVHGNEVFFLYREKTMQEQKKLFRMKLGE